MDAHLPGLDLDPVHEKRVWVLSLNPFDFGAEFESTELDPKIKFDSRSSGSSLRVSDMN